MISIKISHMTTFNLIWQKELSFDAVQAERRGQVPFIGPAAAVEAGVLGAAIPIAGHFGTHHLERRVIYYMSPTMYPY